MKIWTNGCFDVLHRGHIELFRFASSLGDELIVGIDSDEKVKKDKGKNRPINDLHDRMFVLQSIKYIDKVIPFDTTNELERTVKWLKPQFIKPTPEVVEQLKKDLGITPKNEANV